MGDNCYLTSGSTALLSIPLSGTIPRVKLPNGEHADLGAKLEDYTLNPLHRHGRHKARVFQSAFGITLANKAALRRALEQAAAASENATYRGHNGFGEVYELRFLLAIEQRTATVLSGWIIRQNEGFPRLITCFIL